MKKLLFSFFGTTFVLVIVQLSLIFVISELSGISFAQALQQSTIYDVHNVQIGSQTQVFYIFNIKRYINSIKDSITVNFSAFNLDIPEFPKQNYTEIIKALKSIINCLIYVINWLILLVNATVLLPTKFLLTPIIFLIAIMGIDVSNITLLSMITKIYEFNISYINSLG